MSTSTISINMSSENLSMLDVSNSNPTEIVAEEKKKSVDSIVSWSKKDFTDWVDNDFVGDKKVEIDLIDDSAFDLNPADAGKMRYNETHGYTFVDTTETDQLGNKKIVRKLLPRIAQKIRTYKKFIPIRVTFAKVSNDIDIVEEEEDINEEVEVDEITNTLLNHKKTELGEDYVEMMEYIEEIVKNPTKKQKFIKIKLVNDLGEVVDELFELNDDAKRTNDIMRLAAPYMKRAVSKSDSKLRGVVISAAEGDGPSYPEWFKAKDAKKELVNVVAINRLKEARDQQKFLKGVNKYLGRKLCEFYDFKGPKEPNFPYDEGSNLEEAKSKYNKKLNEFNDVINYIFEENTNRSEKIASAELDMQADAENLKTAKQALYELEESLIKNSDQTEENKTQRSLKLKELINQQRAMDISLAKVRLDFVKSQMAIKVLQNKENQHKISIDDMEKVDFISFESLRVQTKDLNDKLDLKEKLVLAMKDQFTERVQALAHIRLKSDHLTAENEKLMTETKDIIDQLKTLRNDCLSVRIDRRKTEKTLQTMTRKEGLEKYPHLQTDSVNVDTKATEQSGQLDDITRKCIYLQSLIGDKLQKHAEDVTKYRKMQKHNKHRRQLYSLEFN